MPNTGPTAVKRQRIAPCLCGLRGGQSTIDGFERHRSGTDDGVIRRSAECAAGVAALERVRGLCSPCSLFLFLHHLRRSLHGLPRLAGIDAVNQASGRANSRGG